MCGIGILGKEIVSGAASGENTEALWFETKADFLRTVKDIIKTGDNVLVKASHGMHLEEIVETLRTL